MSVYNKTIKPVLLHPLIDDSHNRSNHVENITIIFIALILYLISTVSTVQAVEPNVEKQQKTGFFMVLHSAFSVKSIRILTDA
jgi:hypothetical protein